MSASTTDPATHEEVLASFIELGGKRVVDVGSGSGELVRWLRSQQADAVGVECGELMIGLARTADPDHRDDYLEGVGQDLPLPDDSADAVVFSSSLHHVPQAEMVNALREAHRVLHLGGTLYVVEPVAAGPSHEITKLIDDETQVRTDAQTALGEAPTLGFEVIAEPSYTNRRIVRSADALAERIVGIDPTRAERMQQVWPEFLERFEALAVATDDGYVLPQEFRAKVFRKNA